MKGGTAYSDCYSEKPYSFPFAVNLSSRPPALAYIHVKEGAIFLGLIPVYNKILKVSQMLVTQLQPEN